MTSVAHLKQRFLAMPWLLRILVVASVAIGVVFTLLPLIPGAKFGMNERELTLRELWETRVAFALFVVGPLMVVVGVAVFRGVGWVRLVLIALPVVQVLPFLAVHWVFGAPSPVSSLGSFALTCLLWAALAIAYLAGSAGARKHFTNVV